MQGERNGTGRNRLGLVLAALVVGWLGWAQLPGHSLLSPSAPETGDAEWIWIRGAHNRRVPVSFYAVRDFELAAVPTAARWMLLADEEYQAFVNGRRIGSGVYREGARLDTYDVTDLLRPGTNRLIVEVRSGRGTGGLIGYLLDTSEGRVLVQTDEAWRTLLRHTEALFRDWTPIPRGRLAESWGKPPLGRWGRLELGPSRQPARKVVQRRPPRRALALGESRPWGTLRPGGTELPELANSGPRGVMLDFGGEVSGHLSLRFADSSQQRVALVYLSDQPIDPLDDATRYAQPVLGPPDMQPIVIAGRSGWSDAAARRFRYAAVVSKWKIEAVWVDPPESWETVRPSLQAAGYSRRTGLFGLEPPPLRTPVEHEVRSQLQSLARGADR